jgi:hypothetical protein
MPYHGMTLDGAKKYLEKAEEITTSYLRAVLLVIIKAIIELQPWRHE